MLELFSGGVSFYSDQRKDEHSKRCKVVLSLLLHRLRHLLRKIKKTNATRKAAGAHCKNTDECCSMKHSLKKYQKFKKMGRHCLKRVILEKGCAFDACVMAMLQNLQHEVAV